jgi:hypothetical protein
MKLKFIENTYFVDDNECMQHLIWVEQQNKQKKEKIETDGACIFVNDGNEIR